MLCAATSVSSPPSPRRRRRDCVSRASRFRLARERERRFLCPPPGSTDPERLCLRASGKTLASKQSKLSRRGTAACGCLAHKRAKLIRLTHGGLAFPHFPRFLMHSKTMRRRANLFCLAFILRSAGTAAHATFTSAVATADNAPGRCATRGTELRLTKPRPPSRRGRVRPEAPFGADAELAAHVRA